MICKKCIHRHCQIRSKDNGHAIVWRCDIEEKKLWFGFQFEYDAGKNMPNKCKDFEAYKWNKL